MCVCAGDVEKVVGVKWEGKWWDWGRSEKGGKGKELDGQENRNRAEESSKGERIARAMAEGEKSEWEIREGDTGGGGGEKDRKREIRDGC